MARQTNCPDCDAPLPKFTGRGRPRIYCVECSKERRRRPSKNSAPCAVCGKPMQVSATMAKVPCCRACRNRLSGAEKYSRGIVQTPPSPQRALLVCERCGKEFLRSRETRFCSKACRSALCVSCGSPVDYVRESGRTCCNPCRRRLNREEKIALGIVGGLRLGDRRGHDHVCARCGGHFVTERRKAKYCSRSCVNAPADPYANQRKMATKRARRRAAFVEVVDPATLFERDGWRCHICGGKVRRGVDGFDPQAPTIDHVVPLSRGGEHSYRNTACAHRICNMRKGARDVGSQLALVG